MAKSLSQVAHRNLVGNRRRDHHSGGLPAVFLAAQERPRPLPSLGRYERTEFGKWLYSVGSPGTESHDEKVKRLHAAFHKEEAAVPGQALAGKRDEALRAIEPGTKYSDCSAELTREMMEWAKEAA